MEKLSIGWRLAFKCKPCLGSFVLYLFASSGVANQRDLFLQVIVDLYITDDKPMMSISGGTCVCARLDTDMRQSFQIPAMENG